MLRTDIGRSASLQSASMRRGRARKGLTTRLNETGHKGQTEEQKDNETHYSRRHNCRSAAQLSLALLSLAPPPLLHRPHIRIRARLNPPLPPAHSMALARHLSSICDERHGCDKYQALSCYSAPFGMLHAVCTQRHVSRRSSSSRTWTVTPMTSPVPVPHEHHHASDRAKPRLRGDHEPALYVTTREWNRAK
jgi:hypothetical protein